MTGRVSARYLDAYQIKTSDHWRGQPRKPRGQPDGGEWTSGDAVPGTSGVPVSGSSVAPAPSAGTGTSDSPGAPTLARRSARPVSDALAYHSSLSGALRSKVDSALESIDDVHQDGRLTPVPISSERLAGAHGEYRYVDGVDGKLTPNRIALDASGSHPRLTLAHEVGHFIDQQGFGQGKGYASQHDPAPEWVALRAALDNSPTMQRLHSLKNGPATVSTQGVRGRAASYTVDKNYVSYVTRRHETFARAYSQWIAIRSGSAMMLHDLDVRREETRRSRYPDVWDNDEFAPIAAAMDRLFERQGWRSRKEHLHAV